jgi:hypothetical protein
VSANDASVDLTADRFDARIEFIDRIWSLDRLQFVAMEKLDTGAIADRGV